MKSFPRRPRPSLLLAMEFLGLDESAISEGRLQRVIDQVEPVLGQTLLGSDLAKRQEIMCLFNGNRVLRVAPVKPGGGSILFKLLLDIVHVQSDAMHEGIVIRGAVTLGDAAKRGDGVVGQGITEAERLCTEIADAPRVIVDPRLLRAVEDNQDLRAEHHTVPEELGYVRSLLDIDHDGIWFVDYLRAIEGELGDPSEYADELDAHRRLILQKSRPLTTLNRSSRNVLWLWRYHNRVVDAMEKRRPLRVPTSGPLWYEFPPTTEEPSW